MAEITVTGLQKFFGEHHILRNLSFEVFERERVSIIGPNGCGKTTLLKILAGALPYDGGTVSIPKNRRVGLLEQLPDYPPDVTVREVLWQAFAHLDEMSAALRALEQDMAEGKEVDLARYATLQTAFETAGGYETDMRYAMMVSGLDIPPDMQQRPFMSLSGGEKTRVNLARIMLSGTDLLLLDEPTNHLDVDAIEWLEGYLKSFKGAVVIISHDRYFLDSATTRTLELDDGTITSWPGNYSAYVERKRELAEQLEAAKKRQDREIERLSFAVERMKGWGIGNSKLMKRAFGMEKRLERIERIQTIRREHKMRNKFSTAERSGNEVYYVENLSAGYDRPLIEGFEATVFRGERIAIVGPNGCGKTTLLLTLLREIPALRGVIYEGVGVKGGYLPQTITFSRPDRTLLDTLLYETHASTQQARDRLAAFGFTGEEVFKTVSVLSGGEKTRLKLCLFMNTGVNTLFLDEPTNHLDILAREWLEDSVDDFSETMLFVSHDRYFIQRFATRVWEVTEGGVRDFIGTYEEYRAARAAEKARALAAAPTARAAEPKEPKPKPKAQNDKQAQKQRREVEKTVARLERRLAELDEELAAAAHDYVRLTELGSEKELLEAELLDAYEQLEA